MDKWSAFAEEMQLHEAEEEFRRALARRYKGEAWETGLLCLEIARYAHRGQVRADGKPYLIHPIRVALMLMTCEPMSSIEVVLGALLHDAVEDTSLPPGVIDYFFGLYLLEVVLQVTRPKQIGETDSEKWKRKIAKASEIRASDKTVRLIKTYDHLDNMLSWRFIEPESPFSAKLPRWMREAEVMYMPLAKATSMGAYRLMARTFADYSSKGWRPDPQFKI